MEYFSSVFVGVDPVFPADHQVFEGIMDPLPITYDSVTSYGVGLVECTWT